MDDTVKSIALAAASQASEALAALVSVAREGPHRHDRAFDGDTVEQLLDAAKMAIEVEIAAGHEIDEERNQVFGALIKYLEGWA